MNANFGSQGQHRSVVLSLKLAEIELMETVTKEKPILLLDDVMSELDNSRQFNLLETISKYPNIYDNNNSRTSTKRAF